MNKLKNLFLSSVLAFAPFVGLSQDYMGCDYIRELKVKRDTSYFEGNKSQDDFISYGDIKFKEAFADESENDLEGKVMNIYFPTNNSDLSCNDKIDIRRYMVSYLKPNSKWVKINSFMVEGFADFRGGSDLNYNLSKNRAENVLNEISNFFPNADYYVCAYGESKSSEFKDSLELMKDRVVKIIPNENPLISALSNLKGDVYLLDQSGSMNRNGEWNLLQNYSYPADSKVYSFSKVEDAEKFEYKYSISEDFAFGKTSYYSALDTLISSVENKTITTMINGKDNVGGANPDEIIKKAKENNVVLNLIGLNLKDDDKKELLDLVEETDGKYYFLKKSEL